MLTIDELQIMSRYTFKEIAIMMFRRWPQQIWYMAGVPPLVVSWPDPTAFRRAELARLHRTLHTHPTGLTPLVGPLGKLSVHEQLTL